MNFCPFIKRTCHIMQACQGMHTSHTHFFDEAMLTFFSTVTGHSFNFVITRETTT